MNSILLFALALSSVAGLLLFQRKKEKSPKLSKEMAEDIRSAIKEGRSTIVRNGFMATRSERWQKY